VILDIVLAGIVGTAFMSGLMTVIHRSGWANADMIRALGSLLTRSYDKALLPGLLIHFASGIGFAFPYAAIVGAILKPEASGSTFFCVVIGLVHGIVVSLLLLAVVTQRHPVERFRGADFEVAVAHVVGHLGYGLGVGLMFDLFHVYWAVL
jgi:hypothetical protein